MANEATGTLWGLPNYTGELFTADMINTPFLSAIGGLTGGQMTTNFEFATASEYEHETLTQENITENESIAGKTPVMYVRDQTKNVVQIFQEEIILSYVKQSNMGRLTGINTAGSQNNVMSEKDWQIARALEAIARKVEYHFLNGSYNIATTADTANQTRGIIELCAGKNTVDANDAPLSKELFDELLLEMHTNGAIFKNVAVLCGGYQKQKLSNIYGYAPEDRNVGGVNIKQIETDFGNVGVFPAHRMMPATTLVIVELSVCAPVFQPVPGKGNLFYEDLALTGAATTGQIFGQIGLNHGPDFVHGSITELNDGD
jgi:hypothetical protein